MLKTSSTLPPLSEELLKKIKIGIIRSRFNQDMTEGLEMACRCTLAEYGLKEDQIVTTTVPGALEIPITAQALAKTGIYTVLIALGVVIKGDTYHFELVATEATRGCMKVALTHDIPIICEVLAVYTPEQAVTRSKDDAYNKGIEAAKAALEIANTLYQIK